MNCTVGRMILKYAALFSNFIILNLINPKTTAIVGVLFALLWSSSTIAIKIGIKSAAPLTLATIRFLIAGVLLLFFALAISKQQLPLRSEWKKIVVLGLLNVAIYLGCLFYAIEFVTAGLANLFIAINPILIIVFSSMMLKRKITQREMLGFFICFVGLVVASIPYIQLADVSILGIALLIIGRMSYSFGSVYYKKIDLSISNQAVNAWQNFIGGLILLPFAFMLNNRAVVYDVHFFGALIWLVCVVSIVATLLWLNLVKNDTVNAGKWLFLCPVFGYILSYVILGEQITSFELFGIICVIVGLRIISK